MSKIERHFHVKWAGPNTPYIRFCKDAGLDEKRIYLSKRELVALEAEIKSFTHYYREDFMEDRIDIEDLPYDDNL